MSDDVKRSLQKIQAPDEIEAQRRAWALVRASFDAREPVSWQKRNRRPLLAVALAVLVLVAAFLSPPGRALVGSVRDVVTPDKHTPKPKPALTALPAGGSLLVNSGKGPWIVHPDGSKRLLGPYWEGAWSPNAEHVAVTRAHRLAALTPDGTIKWTLDRSNVLHGSRWSLEPPAECCRISYLNGGQLRVVAGDGTGDAPLRSAVGAAPPAWRPAVTRQLAFSTIDGRIELVDVDTTKTIWRTDPGDPPTDLVWSGDGQRLLALGERSLRVFDANGNKLWAIGMPTGPSGVVFVRKSHRFILIRYSPATQRSDLVLFQAETTPGEPRFLYSAPGDFGTLAISQNGEWLLVGWINANQWLFLRLTSAKVMAVSNISEQFGAPPNAASEKAFPSSVSWCCPASP
ncbi:MAG TPA: hypothetical protein VKC65_07905 [Gaiellaceae bacterium]|nr:hypothetical protein [Gaiellaceae bacterium]